MSDNYAHLKSALSDIMADLDVTKGDVTSSFEMSRERSMVLTKIDEAILWLRALEDTIQ